MRELQRRVMLEKATAREMAMTARTQVSATVRNDIHAEVLEALRNVDPYLFQVSVSRSDDPDATTELQVSLAGDVGDAVKERLAAFPDLGCEIDVRDVYDP
jgi:hypothetical protein